MPVLFSLFCLSMVLPQRLSFCAGPLEPAQVPTRPKPTFRQQHRVKPRVRTHTTLWKQIRWIAYPLPSCMLMQKYMFVCKLHTNMQTTCCSQTLCCALCCCCPPRTPWRLVGSGAQLVATPRGKYIMF